jgi:nucleotide-binding universal stress UspA family protein|uniref:UspA domain-containing protein n=2 Tax=Bacteria TaxID=2 RepID=W0FRQ2_9BACT|nr:hypothetical protein [uncultured bacterium Contigcl_10-cl]
MTGAIVVGFVDATVSGHAGDWAVARAAATGGAVELLAIVGGAVGAVGEQQVLDAALAHATDAVAAEAARLGAGGVAVSTRVDHGNPVAALVEASAHAALVVIGGESRGSGRRGLHGARIAAAAHSPVVVVPAADAAGSGVVVGVDGSDVSDAAITFAAAEAARLGEPLRVVSAWTPVAVPGDFGLYPDLYLTDLAAIATANVDAVVQRVASAHPDLAVTGDALEGDPATALEEAGAGAALLVVGSHGRGAFARFVLGSVSEHVVGALPTVTAVVR